jgi:threonine synthase
VQQLEDFNDLTKMELLDYVDNYLDRYSDSKTEAVEAIEQALENGFILTAKREDEIDGVCIIVHMGFEDFIPTYHLAYIGINPNSKGRGIGSELIKEAINLTNGKISLHVDLDNKNAKRLYKKMGFKHVYDRMIYQNQEK